MRARYPDDQGHVERDGVRVFWERYGDGDPTLLYLPGWAFVHSRVFKGHYAYFARHYRVLTFDPRGNGRSDRPLDPAACSNDEYVRDALAVMDASGTESAVLVSGARGAQRALVLAAEHPERVLGALFAGPQPRNQRQLVEALMKGKLDRYEGWDKFNPEYWREDYRGFVEWFAAKNFPEPHMTRGIEEFVEEGMCTDPEALIAATFGPGIRRADLPGIAQRVRCPTLVACGELDDITPPELSRELADLLDTRLVMLPGTGHAMAHGIVSLLLLIREFVDSLARDLATAA